MLSNEFLKQLILFAIIAETISRIYFYLHVLVLAYLILNIKIDT